MYDVSCYMCIICDNMRKTSAHDTQYSLNAHITTRFCPYLLIRQTNGD